MAADLEFRPVAADEGDGAVLIAAMVEEMRELYWDIGAGLDLNSPDMPRPDLPSWVRRTGVPRRLPSGRRGLWRWRQTAARRRV